MKDENSVLVEQKLMEQRHLKNKQTVTDGLQTFYEVGMALAEIRDTKSYKLVDGYDTFEAFCKAEWEMGRNFANKQITAAQVVANLGTIGTQSLTNERQARELTKLKDPEEQREAWKRTLELAGDKKVTAKLVKSVVDEFTASDPGADKKKTGTETPKLMETSIPLVTCPFIHLAKAHHVH